MKKRLKELAEFINGELVGEDILINGVNSIELAKEGELSFISDEKYLKSTVEISMASAFIVKKGIRYNKRPVIFVDNPLLSFTKIMYIFMEKHYDNGIHKTAVIGKNVNIGSNTFIGAYCVIEDNVNIGNNTIIYPNVTILDRVSIANNVIIHSGSVIGSDGFGYVKDEKGINVKIPQLGGVLIEDDVEIGSNVSIDRATFGNTLIKSGVKIDNLCQIAHNVEIGRNVILAGQVGLSGSVVINDGAILAGQVGVADHVRIGRDAVILAKSGVKKDVPDRAVIFWYPAKDHKIISKELAELSRIHKLKERVIELEKKYAMYYKKNSKV